MTRPVPYTISCNRRGLLDGESPETVPSMGVYDFEVYPCFCSAVRKRSAFCRGRCEREACIRIRVIRDDAILRFRPVNNRHVTCPRWESPDVREQPQCRTFNITESWHVSPLE